MRPAQSVFFLLSVAAGIVTAQDLSTVPACAQACFNSASSGNTPTQVGCSPNDQVCLCGKADYRNALRDCVVQTPGCSDSSNTALNALNSYVDSLCAVVATSMPPAASTAPAPSTAPPPPPPPSTTTAPAPSTTAAAPTSAPVQPSTSDPAPSSSTSSTTASSTATTSSSTTDPPAGAQTPTQSTSGSATSSPSSSSTAAAGASNNSSKPEGLSSTTKIGIGVGGAAAAIGVIGVAVCILIHKRNNRRDSGVRSLTISDPMPGSGRSYAGDHHHEKYAVGMSELDFKARRYEDMVPRQSPRHMV